MSRPYEGDGGPIFKMDDNGGGGSPRFPSIQSTSELIDHAIEKGGDLMARAAAMAYESKTRLGEHPSDPDDPFRRVNRLMDWADSRDRVVEQCHAIRDRLEDLSTRMERMSGYEVKCAIDATAKMATEVLIDATGD